MKSKSIQIAISVLLTLGGVQVAQADGATELVHTPGGGRLNNASNGLVSGLEKIKIPAGTSSWESLLPPTVMTNLPPPS